MFVNPMIGIRADQIHQLIAKVEDKKTHPYIPPTVVKNVGYLTPENKFFSYEFPYNEDPSARALRMATDVRQFGVPYIQANASLSAMVNLLPGWIWEEASERLLVAYYLQGKSKKFLLDFIQQRINSGKQEKRFWQRFEAFANKFRERMLV